MSIPVQNYSRDGLPSLLEFSRQLCRIVSAFAPIIRAKFPNNAELLLALTSAETMCGLLPDAIRDAMIAEGDNAPVITDPTEIPGVDPAAPPAPTPPDP